MRQRLTQFDKEAGFSLIELLVVMTILAILSLIAIPMYLNNRQSAWTAAVKNDISKAVIVVQQNKSSDGYFTATSGDPRGFISSENVMISVKTYDANTRACVDGYHSSAASKTEWHYDMSERKLDKGLC